MAINPRPKDTEAYIKALVVPPPAGSPYGLPVPGSERPNRTPAYRHWRFRDQPLMTTYDPEVQSVHDLFEDSARKRPGKRCLGTRNWNSAARKSEDKYDWISYGEVAERRNNFGAGLVEIHKAINYTQDKYGVGVWSQNRTEWQIAGMSSRAEA